MRLQQEAFGAAAGALGGPGARAVALAGAGAGPTPSMTAAASAVGAPASEYGTAAGAGNTPSDHHGIGAVHESGASPQVRQGGRDERGTRRGLGLGSRARDVFFFHSPPILLPLFLFPCLARPPAPPPPRSAGTRRPPSARRTGAAVAASPPFSGRASGPRARSRPRVRRQGGRRRMRTSVPAPTPVVAPPMWTGMRRRAGRCGEARERGGSK
jgi:hypothetical protein